MNYAQAYSHMTATA